MEDFSFSLNQSFVYFELTHTLFFGLQFIIVIISLSKWFSRFGHWKSKFPVVISKLVSVSF